MDPSTLFVQPLNSLLLTWKWPIFYKSKVISAEPFCKSVKEEKRVKEFISFSICSELRSFYCDLSFHLNRLNQWDLHDNENGLS